MYRFFLNEIKAKFILNQNKKYFIFAPILFIVDLTDS